MIFNKYKEIISRIQELEEKIELLELKNITKEDFFARYGNEDIKNLSFAKRICLINFLEHEGLTAMLSRNFLGVCDNKGTLLLIATKVFEIEKFIKNYLLIMEIEEKKLKKNEQ